MGQCRCLRPAGGFPLPDQGLAAWGESRSVLWRDPYYALAENVWNAATKRAEARVVHSFGRADKLDREALNRLVQSINRVLGADEPDRDAARGLPEIEIGRVFELGVVVVARALWEALGIGPAIRRQLDAAGLSAPHEAALFAMAANRLDDPTSKLACAERWLPDVAWLPEARGLKVDQLYRARSTSWPGRPRRSSRRCSCGPLTCSSSTST